MSSAPYDLGISAARAGALSASPLQRSDEPSARQVRHGIATAIGVQDEQGCAARVAQADGEHPRDRARGTRSFPAGSHRSRSPCRGSCADGCGCRLLFHSR
jgi:hypothetical protein